MLRTIRKFLLFEAVTFVIAAVIHSGVLVTGYAHHEARIAESVLAVVLFGAAALSWLWPARIRTIGVAAQSFALLGTLVGVFTIVIGIGPRTPPDLVYHAVVVAVLICGLVIARRAPKRDPQRIR